MYMENTQETLGDRVVATRKKQGWSQADLVRHSGVPQNVLTKIENGQDDTKYVPWLANALKVDAFWLATGTYGWKVAEPESTYKVSSGTNVPLITWDKALTAHIESHKTNDNDSIKTMLACPVQLGANAYAMRVSGNSMINGLTGEGYPAGSIIFVDPSLSGESLDGADVIAITKNQTEVTFKRLAADAGSTFLLPINPAYPPIHDDFVVTGVVKGVWQERLLKGD